MATTTQLDQQMPVDLFCAFALWLVIISEHILFNDVHKESNFNVDYNTR